MEFGSVQVVKNGGSPCPSSVDRARLIFAVLPESVCENKYPAGPERDACKAGALDANKANAAFCEETYAGKPAEINACKGARRHLTVWCHPQ